IVFDRCVNIRQRISFPTRRSSYLQGRYYQLYSAAEVLEVPDADDTNDRIDRVVVRLDLSNAARKISVVYREGTPSGSPSPPALRSEEHTSELQSRENLVCRLLIE